MASSALQPAIMASNSPRQNSSPRAQPSRVRALRPASAVMVSQSAVTTHILPAVSSAIAQRFDMVASKLEAWRVLQDEVDREAAAARNAARRAEVANTRKAEAPRRKEVRCVPSRKPAWNSTIHDLSVHRATRRDIEQRRERIRSANAEVAKAEVLRCREVLASRVSFDGTMFHLVDARQPHDRRLRNEAAARRREQLEVSRQREASEHEWRRKEQLAYRRVVENRNWAAEKALIEQARTHLSSN